ncbi:MAG: N-acetylmuramoyl-L-alanine amidase [Gemmatimonadetes bacterium]|nr:N-acetylmuramoyl-L-alanine amidase [Gemmatimonadota bacterium]
MQKLRLLVPAAALAVLTSCGDGLPVEPPPVSAQCMVESAAVVGTSADLSLDPLFAAAAVEFAVPAPLLKAIGYVETRWQMVEGDPEFPGQPAAFGVMALRGEQLEQGARLAGVPVDAVRADPEANIRAAAALLRAYADQLEVRSSDLAAWAPAVARYSGIQLPEGRASYVHDDVYATLRRGAVGRARDGSVTASLAPVQVAPGYLQSLNPGSRTLSADYSGAVWRASPNRNARPAGDIGKIAMVIIHTCEGSYTGCWSWLANRDSRVSAHYVVREDGSEITQLVRDADRGWHIGSSYDCALNRSFECWRNGNSNNHFTIGIEHAGYASQTVWSAGQLDASAKLVCDLTRRHGIRRDDIHILGHAQLQPHNRTDPGANWLWAQYHVRIDAHCGGTAAEEIVIDGDHTGNDRSRGYLTVSSRWTSTRATPGHYGSGYYFAPTGDAADPAAFHFYLPAPATKTVEAWWTAGTNRSPSASFSVADGNGRRLGEARVDQQRDGQRWNALGTWSFPAGWNTVQLSRLGPTGCVVIADAVRVR